METMVEYPEQRDNYLTTAEAPMSKQEAVTQNGVPVADVIACSFCESTVDEVMYMAHNGKAAVCDGCARKMVMEAVKHSYHNSELVQELANEVIRLKEESRITIATNEDVEKIIAEQNDV